MAISRNIGAQWAKGQMMSGEMQKKRKMLQSSVALIAVLGLSACDENGEFQMPAFDAGAEDGSAIAAPVSQSVETDVEAPDVFQVTDAGLWDGRPSLGGVWVAHPDVQDPERVIIRNETNGKFVIGALFRRERDNPGPALQVSSDAAETLGLLAGAPTQLNVTALRREEVPVVATPTATTDFDTPSEISATPLDPIAGAAAAIEAAEVAPTPPPVTPAPVCAANQITLVRHTPFAGTIAPVVIF